MSPPIEDDGPPTPRVSGSYAVFRDEASRVARMLDQVSLIREKRIDLYDEREIAHARKMALELRAMARRFHAWPSLGAEAVARERAELLPELKRVLEVARNVLDALPAMGALGRVNRPRR